MKVANESVYLGLSKDKELLRVELLNVMDNKEGWYVVYWESLLNFNNNKGDNEIMINDRIGININSLSDKYGYRIFDSKRDAVTFIYHNEEFMVLK